MIMRIGIDIDNTLCDTDLIAKKIYKKKNNGKDLSDLDKYSHYQNMRFAKHRYLVLQREDLQCQAVH